MALVIEILPTKLSKCKTLNDKILYFDVFLTIMAFGFMSLMFMFSGLIMSVNTLQHYGNSDIADKIFYTMMIFAILLLIPMLMAFIKIRRVK